MERDLREVLITELMPYHNLDDILSQSELQKVQERSKKSEVDGDVIDGSEYNLTHYLDFLDTIQIINRNKAELANTPAAYFTSVTSELEKCAPIRNAVMHGRPLEIDYFATVCNIADELTEQASSSWKNLSRTLSEIENDSSYVFGLSFTIRDDTASSIYSNLPIPDFDDTGFVGRESTIARINEAIEGTFPVISLIGPGGVGKTALALKVAHLLLERNSSKFDAIVWVSAKANTLTAKEVIRIENAIEDSIGVFSMVAEEFEAESKKDPEDRVVDLLSSFRTLLIIDNLESVLDERLRRFIQKTPVGSKILLTSRIAIGSGDLSIQIEPLTLSESRVYLRKLVQSYSVSLLESIRENTADQYIKRLHFNPLFLKWFVTAVKSGLMPEKVLSNQADILRFCLENVVENLDDFAKQICSVYLVIEGPHSLAMLARLTELLPDQLEMSISKLITCNILTMVSINNLGDTAYQM
ncbi:MAG: NB-ARC domain-containing protein, partial [Gammaproteobacteria bacterium]|nr:NB-ARC domain-containing protein [Gammaproteobacteria bacterium]